MSPGFIRVWERLFSRPYPDPEQCFSTLHVKSYKKMKSIIMIVKWKVAIFLYKREIKKGAILSNLKEWYRSQTWWDDILFSYKMVGDQVPKLFWMNLWFYNNTINMIKRIVVGLWLSTKTVCSNTFYIPGFALSAKDRLDINVCPSSKKSWLIFYSR